VGTAEQPIVPLEGTGVDQGIYVGVLDVYAHFERAVPGCGTRRRTRSGTCAATERWTLRGTSVALATIAGHCGHIVSDTSVLSSSRRLRRTDLPRTPVNTAGGAGALDARLFPVFPT
jgi:hypothetical protein